MSGKVVEIVRRLILNKSSKIEAAEGYPFDALTVGVENTVGTGADLTLLTIAAVTGKHIVVLGVTVCATGAAWFWLRDGASTEIPFRLPADGMYESERKSEMDPIDVASSGSAVTLVVETSNAALYYAGSITYVLRDAPT